MRLTRDLVYAIQKFWIFAGIKFREFREFTVFQLIPLRKVNNFDIY